MKCDKCKKVFYFGNHSDGTPNGIAFETADGTITLCRDCIIKLGALDEKSKAEFFRGLKCGEGSL